MPPGYGAHFKSFDGKARNFMVEGIGGPSWYAEYNVLAGLSARSFGRFSYFVTRIAAGRVTRGLPNALRRCGYQTFSLYPSLGAFMSARSFQTTTGMQQFSDSDRHGRKGLQPDKFYYDKATAPDRERARARGRCSCSSISPPTISPGTIASAPDLAPEWRDLENPPEVNEYLRRQTMSAQDYAGFLADLKQKFPGEVLPAGALWRSPAGLLRPHHGPVADDAAIARADDDVRSEILHDLLRHRRDQLQTGGCVLGGWIRSTGLICRWWCRRLPGLPLDPSFAEQKNILKRCGGIFYACNGGAEARRFNRLLIDAGLIKQL